MWLVPSDSSDIINRKLAEVPTITSKVGIFVSRTGNSAKVNVGTSSVTLPFVGLYLPPPGHPVQLSSVNAQVVVTGPARPLPGVGKVTATGSPRATVTAWGVSYVLPYQTSYTPALNDDVAIVWSADGGLITGKVSAVSNVLPPDANSGGGSGAFHPAPFTAIDSGTWRAGSGWWTPTVRANVDDGAWFYGSKVKDTIPDTATIVSAFIYLPIQQIVVNAPGQLRLHIHPTKPAGAPTFTGSATGISAEPGWRQIPNSFIDYLKANDGGIGFDGGGQWVNYGVSSDQLSGALDIAWTA